MKNQDKFAFALTDDEMNALRLAVDYYETVLEDNQDTRGHRVLARAWTKLVQGSSNGQTKGNA